VQAISSQSGRYSSQLWLDITFRRPGHSEAGMRERLSIFHAKPTFNNIDKLQEREASDSRVSMCNVETRESATLMSYQQGGQ
jgi:hypothetical protein